MSVHVLPEREQECPFECTFSPSPTRALILYITATALFESNLVSLFPIAIFPAAFILSCKNVNTEGPTIFKSQCRPPARKRDWSTPEAKEEMDFRVLEHASVDAMPMGESDESLCSAALATSQVKGSIS